MTKYIYTIEQDDSGYFDSPRQWDNLFTFCFFHKDYKNGLGDKQNICETSNYNSYAEMKVDLEKQGYIAYPVFCYEHGAIAISLRPFSCSWDSGQLGFAVIHKNKIKKEYNCKRITKSIIEKVYSNLIAEVTALNKYINNEIYCYVIKNENDEVIDSCTGFYDYDYCEQEAKFAIEYLEKQDIENGLQMELSL